MRSVLAPAPKDRKNISGSVQAMLKEPDGTVMGAFIQSTLRANALIAGNKFDEAELVLK